MTDLKLLALDAEDLAVISAHAQDGLVRVADLGYARRDRRFALLMNRYDWSDPARRGAGLRKRAGLHFEHVERVTHAGFDPNAPEGVLELLAVSFTPAEDGVSGTVELAFAGGGTIRLSVECLEARLADLGATWAAAARPDHALD